MQDLLQQELPGVEFSYAMNQQTHLNFPGLAGRGVLFLVDGERLAGETMDDVDFTRPEHGQRGTHRDSKGRSVGTVWQLNATGGVINIITKRNRQPWTLNMNARYAKHNEQRYGISYGFNRRHWGNLLTANFNSTDNYDVHSAANPLTTHHLYRLRRQDNESKRAIGVSPADNFRLTGRAGYFFRETVRSGRPALNATVTSAEACVWTGISLKETSCRQSYAFDQYDKSDYQRITRLDVRDYSNNANSVRMLYNHSLNNGDMLTIGADYMHDYLYNTNLDGETQAGHMGRVCAIRLAL